MNHLEFYVDTKGREHISRVRCKGCHEVIVDSEIGPDAEGVNVPKQKPMPNYTDMYINYVDEKGELRRQSTPMCQTCAEKDWKWSDLNSMQKKDIEGMKHRLESAGEIKDRDREVIDRLEKGKILKKIGYASLGYAIVGEGK